jgi:ribosomal protein L29
MKQKESLKQLKTLDTKTLAKELAASNKKLVELRFGAKMRKLKNFNEIGNERKKIARIWTLINEKTIEAVAAAVKAEQGKVTNAK